MSRTSRVGRCIADAREVRGESLRSLAARCDVSHVYIAEIERGKGASASKVIAIADALKIDRADALQLWRLDRFDEIDAEVTRARKTVRR